MIKRLLALCIITLCSTSLLAEELMTIEQAIDTAIMNNPAIKAAAQGVKVKEMEKNSALAKMLPTVEARYNYGLLEEAPPAWSPVVKVPNSNTLADPSTLGYDGETALMMPFIDGTTQYSGHAYVPMAGKRNLSAEVEVSQVLFAGGALVQNYKISENSQLAAGLQSEQATRDIKLNTIKSYYGVLEAREFMALADQVLSSIAAHEKKAQAFFNEGMIPKNDLLAAQVQYAEGEQDLIRATNAVQRAEAAFNMMLSRPLSTPVTIETEIAENPVSDTLETATGIAMERRQELKILGLQLDSARRGVKAANAAFMPSVGASCTWKESGTDRKYSDWDGSWQAGVGVSWKLFEGSSHYWDQAKARNMQIQLDYYLQSQQEMVELEVKNSYLNVLEAKARIDVAAKAIDQALENLRIEQDRFNLQVATSTDVLDATARASQAGQNLISARIDYAEAVAELQAAMGVL